MPANMTLPACHQPPGQGTPRVDYTRGHKHWHTGRENGVILYVVLCSISSVVANPPWQMAAMAKTIGKGEKQVKI